MGAKGTWITRGFDAFSRGTCGNAGHNLYVSRAGVVQRIHQYDFNKDGFFDLVICNSQNHWEKPPAYVYRDPLGRPERIDLPSDGARAGVVADLNGDGYDDLVLGMFYNGIRQDLNALIYYGAPDGWSERRTQQLPAPACTSVAAGDFNGDGKRDLAFLCQGKVRIFYQGALGFEPKRFVDLDISGEQLEADDLDADGCAELIVRTKDGRLCIYWGAAGGLDPAGVTEVPCEKEQPQASAGEKTMFEKYAEWVEDAALLVRVVRLAGMPYLFVPQAERVFLVPVDRQRQFGPPLTLACSRALSIAAGDINGDGHLDLVLACRQPDGAGECSWVYWGGPAGYDESRRSKLSSFRACDVALADLDDDGCADVILCQSHTEASFTYESLIYRGGAAGIVQEPLRLVSEDARRVLVGRPDSSRRPHVAFANYFARNKLGNIDASIFFGGPDGFAPDRRQDVPAWGAVEAICADVNDDGEIDLVLANAAENSVDHDPGSYVLLGGPAGFGREPSLIVPTQRAHGVCCADINRDGYLDLVFCGFDNPEIVVFYGTPTGFDLAHPTRIKLEYDGVVYNESRWIYLADLNNDGWLDLIVPQITFDRSLILWGGPAGFSMEHCQALSVVRAGCARAADLTGNGYLDLIVGGHMPDPNGPHDSFVYIYWNGPDGLREDNRTLLPAKTINSMAVADFNNDGLLDLFICSYHDIKERDVDSYLYWNRPGRGFAADDRLRLFTHSASGCVAGDFNEDGWIDLAVAYHKVWGDHLGWSAVFWNGPEGFDERRITRLPCSGPHGMTAIGPGNIMDRGPEEFYTSETFELPAGGRVASIAWQAEVPAKTWVMAQVRCGATPADVAGAAWQGPAGPGSWYENGQALAATDGAGPFVQYRLALGAINSLRTPRVSEVTFTYERNAE